MKLTHEHFQWQVLLLVVLILQVLLRKANVQGGREVDVPRPLYVRHYSGYG
jgi:hypothetical protein